jgi:hypothetical protein
VASICTDVQHRSARGPRAAPLHRPARTGKIAPIAVEGWVAGNLRNVRDVCERSADEVIFDGGSAVGCICADGQPRSTSTESKPDPKAASSPTDRLRGMGATFGAGPMSSTGSTAPTSRPHGRFCPAGDGGGDVRDGAARNAPRVGANHHGSANEGAGCSTVGDPYRFLHEVRFGSQTSAGEESSGRGGGMPSRRPSCEQQHTCRWEELPSGTPSPLPPSPKPLRPAVR